MNLKKITLIILMSVCSQIMASDDETRSSHDLRIKIEYGPNFLNIQKHELGQPTRMPIGRNIDLFYFLNRQHHSEDYKKTVFENRIKNLFSKIDIVYDETEITNKVSAFINEINN